MHICFCPPASDISTVVAFQCPRTSPRKGIIHAYSTKWLSHLLKGEKGFNKMGKKQKENSFQSYFNWTQQATSSEPYASAPGAVLLPYKESQQQIPEWGWLGTFCLCLFTASGHYHCYESLSCRSSSRFKIHIPPLIGLTRIIATRSSLGY